MNILIITINEFVFYKVFYLHLFYFIITILIFINNIILYLRPLYIIATIIVDFFLM